MVGVLLTLSIPARPATGANPSVPSGNWLGSEGVYPYNFDWANQTQIGPSNVNQLQVSWVYPTPPTPSQYLAYNKFTTVPIGITSTGNLINGITYTITQYMLLQAINAHTGALIWSAQLPNMKFNCMHNQLQINGANLTGHFHNIWYTSSVKGVWANTPMIWVFGSNHTAFAFNALTGVMLTHWQTYNPCATFGNGATGAAGNFGLYDTTTQNAVFDTQKGILVTGASSPESTDAPRGFFIGYNISVNPPKMLWQSFTQPPQDGSDPNWDINSVGNMTNAWIFNAPKGNAVDLKSLPADQLKAMLYDDWGYAKYFNKTSGHSYAGSGTSWGMNWALDPSSGNAFVATSQPSDFPNETLRPGPNLWADSILSINEQTGKINWAFETSPHDPWDMDCSWTEMLVHLTINGQDHLAVLKSCKSAYVWALDAQTGAILWYFYPGPSDLGYNGLPTSVCSGATSCPIPNNSQFKASLWNPPYSHQLDPTNRSQMTKGWANYPSKGWSYEGPYGNGAAESNGAFDPTNNMFFYGVMNDPTNVTAGPASGPGYIWGSGTSKATNAPSLAPYYNSTIWAINGNTGQPVWNRFIPKIGFRGGVSATNGMLLVPLDNGSLLFLNEQTGAMLRNFFIGSAMVTQPMIGTDVAGKTEIVLPAELPISSGVYAGTGRTTSTPGFLFAIALGPGAAVSTITSTATSTVSAPASTVTSTVSTTAPGSASTVTSTTSAVSTTTIIQSTGIDPTTFYAVGAVAVIGLAAAGFFAVRRRPKAAS